MEDWWTQHNPPPNANKYDPNDNKNRTINWAFASFEGICPCIGWMREYAYSHTYEGQMTQDSHGNFVFPSTEFTQVETEEGAYNAAAKAGLLECCPNHGDDDDI